MDSESILKKLNELESKIDSLTTSLQESIENSCVKDGQQDEKLKILLRNNSKKINNQYIVLGSLLGVLLIIFFRIDFSNSEQLGETFIDRGFEFGGLALSIGAGAYGVKTIRDSNQLESELEDE